MRRLVFLARWFVVGCRRGDGARGGRAGRGSGSAAHLAHDGEAAETDAGLFLVGHGVHAETCGVRAGRGDAGERDTRDRADILRARPFGATRGRWEPRGAREAPRQGNDGAGGGVPAERTAGLELALVDRLRGRSSGREKAGTAEAAETLNITARDELTRGDPTRVRRSTRGRTRRREVERVRSFLERGAGRCGAERELSSLEMSRGLPRLFTPAVREKRA